MEPGELQRQIDSSLQEQAALMKITLGNGSDVVDLTCNVDGRVLISGQAPRYFTIISQQWVARMFDEDWGMSAENKDIYASRCPLIIVKQISGDTIVRGVIHYLHLEEET